MDKKLQTTRLQTEEGRFFMSRESGFSLVELMIVVAIAAILASVAIPAYMNHINRVRQGDAITVLMDAKLGQEIYWGENDRYAGRIGCLENFGAAEPCDGTASNEYYTKPGNQGYKIYVQSASTDKYIIRAENKIYDWAGTDIITIEESDAAPVVWDNITPSPLKFSIFQWIF